MRKWSGDELLALPLRLHGIQLGRPADLLLDRETLRVVGVDVACGDDVHRFLPLTTAVVEDDALVIRSPLVLLEEDQLAFYRSRTFTLSSLRDRAVQRESRTLGSLRDVVVAADGTLAAVVLAGGGKIAFDETLRFVPQQRSAA